MKNKKFEEEVFKELEDVWLAIPLKDHFGRDYELFLKDSVHHNKILWWCRKGKISVEEYGKLLKLLWSDDTESCQLAYTIIQNKEDEAKRKLKEHDQGKSV